MPTYQYRCAKCGEQFEQWQSIHDDALTVHDGDCGGALLKVLGMGGIVLKGSGFYRTDNRSKPGGREQEREGSKSDTSSGNGSGDSKKTDSASKSETTTSETTTSGASKSDSSKS